ncbi:gigantea [Musa troglodytarum]|uniref:Gigantea n=1 Tax=Musa troglodytarum TaxID=320322 RepID=A0A9E7GV79_9LILI|nr:gigantea [Musa troglodytarum]
MSVSNEKWIDGLQFSSLFWPPPQDEKQRQAQVLAYVEYFSQFTSEEFPEDIAQVWWGHGQICSWRRTKTSNNWFVNRGSGKQPLLMPSTPRWAVANGAGVILSVCDEEVAHYETANLTAAAVPALLLPPPTTPLDEHLVAGLPPLEPYARLFHRYYAIATPSATQRLLLGLLEAPPSWAPDALDAAVQLVELLRAAEDYASGMRLPRNWMHLHFLRAIGIAMSMRAGVAADAAAALLFRILSQPTLLFPPLRHAEGVEVHHEPLGGFISSYKKQAEKDLQPWIARDDEQGQRMWKINHRIVKLIVELMRNHEGPEALIILASASDLLLRATDGMLVDGEVCTLPQLELLEVTAKAVQLVIHWGEPGLAVADGLANLLKVAASDSAPL